MRILLDYRPALRARTGVGEFVHELGRALASTAAARGDEVTLLTSSWKDRPPATLARDLSVRVVDKRLPVRALTWAWHTMEWPPVELLAGPCDIAHAAGALLLPARRAARIVTVHDLDVLDHPDHGEGEMRSAYPRLLESHARRAEHVIVPSHYVAGEVTTRLGVPAERVTACGLGAPAWAPAVREARAGRRGSTILFLGTIGPRKNIGVLLDAYRCLASRHKDVPPLVLAGRVMPGEGAIERALATPVPGGRVTATGYVAEQAKPGLYADAAMLVLPSLDEGFGLPVLEAMACGVPVVVSNRGALPEVAGRAAAPVDPADVEGFAGEMATLLDPERAADAAGRGYAEAARYTWDTAAAAVREAYARAITRRSRR